MSLRGEVQADDVVEVGRDLVRGEAQVGGADLDQLAAGPQPRQRQRRVGPAADHQVHLRREVLQQERHAGLEVGPVDQVVVVEHQVDLVRRGASSLSRVARTVSIGGWADCSSGSAPAPTPGTAVCRAVIT